MRVHVHAARPCCDCGAELPGRVTVQGYEFVQACPTCGKPRERWGDKQSYRDVTDHNPNCPVIRNAPVVLPEDPDDL